MSIPKYNELYSPFLSVLQDEGIHTIKEVKDNVAKLLQLSEENLTERLPSNKQTVYDNRIGWARTYLKKAGLIVSPQRAQFVITKEGKNLFESGLEITDTLLAERYPEFAAFVGNGKTENNNELEQIESTETPMETLERVHKSINDQLADELLLEIMNQSPTFFENLVVDLMKTMGYGEGFVTKSSGDGGIDGVVYEDKLGFNLIYIQAKKWNTDTTIGRPEIQKFAGAMMGPPKIEKGLFITTAKFSQGAKDFAEAQHIILVDGKRLAELMIECGVGVSVQKEYIVKKLDLDYFVED
ncbi:MAG: restriction endonuclease [Lachnospiraceae bacterium]|nr:restriction endonuclease [Lachnospiraceae bacterium]